MIIYGYITNSLTGMPIPTANASIYTTHLPREVVKKLDVDDFGRYSFEWDIEPVVGKGHQIVVSAEGFQLNGIHIPNPDEDTPQVRRDLALLPMERPVAPPPAPTIAPEPTYVEVEGQEQENGWLPKLKDYGPWAVTLIASGIIGFFLNRFLSKHFPDKEVSG